MRELEALDAIRLFTRDDLADLRDELAALPPSEDRYLVEKVGRIRRLVELAFADEQLALGTSVF